MAAKSKHYGDIAIWIEEVIDSCNHPLQEVVARKLIRNFGKQLDRLDMDVHLRYSIIRPLELQLENKRWDRIEKRIK
jgi:hypothetical protein